MNKTVKHIVEGFDFGNISNDNPSKNSNKSAKTLADLKVINHTLIKISGDTITEYYENDEITTKLS